MANQDPYLPVADALVAALEKANGDETEEDAALEKAVDEYIAIAAQPKAHPAELMLAEYLCDEGVPDRPPALERVKGATEEQMSRWRDKIIELADY